MFRQDAFRNVNFPCFATPDAQLLQLDVGDAALTAAVLELVGLLQAELPPDQTVALDVFRVRRQITELLLLQDCSDRLGNFLIITAGVFDHVYERLETTVVSLTFDGWEGEAQ